MKKLLLLLALFLSVLSVEAQIQDCMHPFNAMFVDSISFENTNDTIVKIIIDTTYSNNIWQIGAVQKTNFPFANSGINALQTDTLNTYSTNNESAVIVYPSYHSGIIDNASSMCFWHYYITDTISDYCILQTTVDSGKTWSNFDSLFQFGGHFEYTGSLNNYQSNYYNGSLRWSGTSGSWKKECLCSVYYGVKGISIPRLYGYRFLFLSDSIETYKPGWMIDDITFRKPFFYGGIFNDHPLQSANIYPNPSSNGIFNIDYPQHYVKGMVEIFNVFGQRIKTLPLSPSINLQDIPRGIYHYTIFFQTTAQQFSGTLMYE